MKWNLTLLYKKLIKMDKAWQHLEVVPRQIWCCKACQNVSSTVSLGSWTQYEYLQWRILDGGRHGIPQWLNMATDESIFSGVCPEPLSCHLSHTVQCSLYHSHHLNGSKESITLVHGTNGHHTYCARSCNNWVR